MFIKVSTIRGTKIKLNTNHISWVGDKSVIMSNGSVLELDETSHKQIDAIISPKERAEKETDKDMVALFEKLHSLTGGKGKAVFSLGREKKLKELLTKHRLTKEDLLRAAKNIGTDAFLQGDNPGNKRYGDIDYLLRPDKAAKWAEEQEQKKKGMF